MLIEDQFIKTLREWTETSTHRSIHAFIRHNRESELSLSQVSTLFRLFHHGPNSVNDLADHLGISMAAVSQLLNQLMDAELILRSEDPSDRRVKLIGLTEKGMLAVEKSIQARHAWVDELAQMFTPEEKNQILPALQLLHHHTQQLMHESDPKCVKVFGDTSKDE